MAIFNRSQDLLYSASGTGTSVTVGTSGAPWPNNTVPKTNDLVIVFFTWVSDPGSTPTISPSGTWFFPSGTPFSTSAHGYQGLAYTIWGAAGDVDNTVFTWTNNIAFTVHTAAFAGIDTSGAATVDTHSGGGGTNTGFGFGNITPPTTGAQGNELWILTASVDTVANPYQSQTVTDPVPDNVWRFGNRSYHGTAATAGFMSWMVSPSAQRPGPTFIYPVGGVSTSGTVWIGAFKGSDASPVNTVAPALSTNTPTIGTTVTVTNGTWTGTPGVTGYTFQWYTSTSSSFASGITGPYVISGAAAGANYFRPPDSAEGQYIRATITASNGTGATSAFSNITTSPIAQAAPVNTTPPQIQGLPNVGTVLSLASGNGVWLGMTGTTHTYAYQWQTAATAGFGSPTNVSTASTYNLTSTDLNKYVRVQVTATNGIGSTTVSSTVIGPVQTTLTYASTVTNVVQPTWKLEFSPTTDPATTPVWVDITSRLIRWQSQRGRQFELDIIAAGTASVTLSNDDRALDPTNTASTYYNSGTGLVPLKRMRLSCTYLGATYYWFSGYVEGWPQTWEGTDYAEVTLTLTDAFEPFAQTQLLSANATLTTAFGGNADLKYTAILFGGGFNAVSIQYFASDPSTGLSVTVDELNLLISISLNVNTSGVVISTANQVMDAVNTSLVASGLITAALAPGSNGSGFPTTLGRTFLSGGTFVTELSGTRINRVLDSMNPPWPTTDRLIDVGGFYVGASGFGPADNATVLQHIQDVSNSELGYVFMNGAGQVVYHDANHRTTATLSTTSQGTFGDVQGELEYKELVPNFDLTHISNEVKITPGSLSTQTASDSTSQTRYYKRSLQRTTLLTTVSDASTQAAALLARYKDPRFRYSSMVIEPLQNLDLWQQALNREIGDRITVNRRPPDATNQVQPAYKDAILSTGGLTNYWRLDETSGTLFDIIGGLNGTSHGTVTRNVTGLIADGTKAVSLNGAAGSYIDTASNVPPGALSVEAWIKPSSVASGQAIVDWSNDTVQLEVTTNNTVRWYVRDTAATDSIFTGAPNALTVSGTYHLLGTYDAAQGLIALYINGVLSGTANRTPTLRAANGSVPLQIGAVQGGASGNFNGVIDEVAVYNRALTAAEALTHYNQGFSTTVGSAAPIQSVQCFVESVSLSLVEQDALITYLLSNVSG